MPPKRYEWFLLPGLVLVIGAGVLLGNQMTAAPAAVLVIAEVTATPGAVLPLATATPAPTLTPVPPTATPLPPTATPTPPPTATPPPPTPVIPFPASINGVASADIIGLPPTVRRRIAMLADLGQIMGRNPRAFSRLGDSVIENPHFLARFDESAYNLGDYAYLAPVIAYYQGSFGRQGVAVRRGLHSWSVFDPLWAGQGDCFANETLIACELRLNNPSILFIRLGSNDFGVPDSFDKAMRRIVEYAMNAGVIPILSTKADRFRDPDDVNNTIIRQIAADYWLPLWDFDRVAATIPGKGIGSDGVHLTTFFAHDYTQPQGFQTGYGLQNLSALMALEAVWQVIQQHRSNG
ncbi:MAG: SGNH/GDSL hydrolase family protein [Anaerolineae bacterium]|nr:SGNH/GDSL hydrolase family protein [Anaerolineae bacterium]